MADDVESRLLALAPELRNRIYDMVFEDEVVDWDDREYCTPGLLLTCKQVHTEACTVFWSLSTFMGSSPTRVMRRLRRQPSESKSLIGKVRVDLVAAQAPQYSKPFYAQRELFSLQGRILAEGFKKFENPGAIQVSVRFPFGDLQSSQTWWSDDPFRSFAARCTAAAKEGTLDVSVVRVNDNLIRFFEYQHLNPLKCWSREWRLDQHHCGCPANTT